MSMIKLLIYQLLSHKNLWFYLFKAPLLRSKSAQAYEDNIIHYSDSALTQIFINNNLLSKIIIRNIYFVLSI